MQLQTFPPIIRKHNGISNFKIVFASQSKNIDKKTLKGKFSIATLLVPLTKNIPIYKVALMAFAALIIRKHNEMCNF